ncbi:MAG: threonine synthase [Sporichthyaceae bacterium]|nr:threonine synthase [Sporichthyaceae bacterium]
MYLTNLECAACERGHPPGRLHNLCESCGMPLLARYDLDAAGAALAKTSLATRPANLWRYRELLPVADPAAVVTLGEGYTPLLRADRLGARLGLANLYVKDEALNPTGTFKARGMAVAVSMARQLGATELAVPSAGNAGGALAAYAARAGLSAHVFMPRDTPRANVVECERAGARITLVDGLISDCARLVAEYCGNGGGFDVSTLREPYRVEGKKTMGFELAEQLGWRLPDVVVYPTGGGTGLVGMWKAFDELAQLGWIDGYRPRMVAVQADGCAPIVTAFLAGATHATEVVGATTVASGLRVPRAIGDFIMLDVLRRSGGTAIAVSDPELLAAVAELDRLEGIFPAPEGAACVPAVRKLVANGEIGADEIVVIFNTGSGLKYL